MVSQTIRDIKISAMVIGVTFLIFSGAFFWFQRDMDQRAYEDGVSNIKIASQTRSVIAFAKNKQDAPAAAVYQKAMDALIPPKNQILSFPQWFDAQGRAAKISTRFSLSGNETAAQGDTPGHINFTADLSGNVNDVVSFLHMLETQMSQYLISVGAIDMQRSGGDYTATIQGQLFFK